MSKERDWTFLSLSFSLFFFFQLSLERKRLLCGLMSLLVGEVRRKGGGPEPSEPASEYVASLAFWGQGRGR